MGWVDSLKLLEATLAVGGRPWPIPEAPDGKMVTTTPHTLHKHILTVLLQLGPSFCRSGGACGPESRILRSLSYRWSAELKEPGLKLGQGGRWRPLAGEQEDTIFLELQRIWWERRWRG